MALCGVDLLNVLISLLYLALCLSCVSQIHTHWSSFRAERALSLKVYLFCTALFTALRALDFFLTPFLSPCGSKEWQWQLLGASSSSSSSSGGGGGAVFVVFIATVPSALFFTSYTSFAYSLARVYDLLTQNNSSPLLRSVLGILNVAIYLSLLLYYFAVISSEGSDDDGSEASSSRLAQVTLSISALITAAGLVTYGVYTSQYFQRIMQDPQHPIHVMQLDRFLQVRKIIMISLICTVCFALRAAILLSKVHLSAWATAIYFVVIEVVPTAYMLFAFRARSSATPVFAGGDRSEYELLKNQLTTGATGGGAIDTAAGTAVHAGDASDLAMGALPGSGGGPSIALSTAAAHGSLGYSDVDGPDASMTRSYNMGTMGNTALDSDDFGLDDETGGGDELRPYLSTYQISAEGMDFGNGMDPA